MPGLHLVNVFPETISDGVGIRYAIYLAGCRHHCPGCHNPETWNPFMGELVTDSIVDRIVSEINSNPILDGVTFSGGDPFYNPDDFFDFLVRIKRETKKNIWCYTGYLYEELAFIEKFSRCLKYIDVLVDGKFIGNLYDPRLYFRGSSNQRVLILKDGKVAGECNLE